MSDKISGWDWAKSEIDKGTTVDIIEAYIDGSIDYTDFDRGAAAFLRGESREDQYPNNIKWLY